MEGRFLFYVGTLIKFVHMAELIEAVEKGSGGGEDNL
jgi:hypothetical protein